MEVKRADDNSSQGVNEANRAAKAANDTLQQIRKKKRTNDILFAIQIQRKKLVIAFNGVLCFSTMHSEIYWPLYVDGKRKLRSPEYTIFGL